ncbi:MAG: serine hydrolase domain-containing protein [Thiohalomonadales bacterium]
MLTKSMKQHKLSLTTYSLYLILLLFTGIAQSNNTSNTHEIMVANIRNAISTFQEDYKIPGMAVALINKNKIVFSDGFGVSNIETQQAVTPNTSFWLASVSKTAVGVAIMHAQEQGFLNLDDNVNTLLKNKGDFNLDTPFAKPVLLKHLVTHTSSIIDNEVSYACAYFVEESPGHYYNFENRFNGGNCDETVPVSLEGYLTATLSKNGAYYSAQQNFLTANPGSRYEYSNIGAALAGLTLQFVTGTSLADYAKTHIFDPLDMRDTSWLLSDLDPSNIAIPYEWDNVNKKMVPYPIYSLSTWPDGGLRSSVNDLAKYLMMVSNGGKFEDTRILQEQSIKTMLAPTVIANDPTVITNEEAIGVFWRTITLPSGRILIGHDGSDYGAISDIEFDPALKTGITLIMNGVAELDNKLLPRFVALRQLLLNYAELLGNLD